MGNLTHTMYFNGNNGNGVRGTQTNHLTISQDVNCDIDHGLSMDELKESINSIVNIEIDYSDLGVDGYGNGYATLNLSNCEQDEIAHIIKTLVKNGFDNLIWE